MKRCASRFWPTSLLGIACCLCRTAVCQEVPQSPPIPNPAIAAALVVPAGKGTPVGSCFLVDASGLFVASFTTVQEKPSLAVRIINGQSWKVAEAIAADRSRDLVILRVNQFRAAIPPFPMLAETKVGMETITFGGGGQVRPGFPLILPINDLGVTLTPTVVRPLVRWQLRSPALALTFAENDDLPIGANPQADWLLMDRGLPVEFAGGPMVDAAGNVVGMMSGANQVKNQVFAAIHVRHIVDLLKQAQAAPQSIPLPSLKAWVDSPSKEVAEPAKDKSDLMGAVVHRLSLADRVRSLPARMGHAARELAQAEQLPARVRNEIVQQRQQIQQARDQLTAMVPNRVVQREVEDREVDRRTGRVTTRRRTESRREFSVEQLSERRSLAVEIMKHELEVVRHERDEMFNSEVRLPVLRNLNRFTEDEVFFLADPCGMRTNEEHREVEQALSQWILAGGAPASVYAARAIVRVHLANYEDARLDLREVLDIQPKEKALTLAIEALIAARDNEKSLAGQRLLEAGRLVKDKGRLKMLAAAVALRFNDPDQALTELNLARTSRLHPVELDVLCAWIRATGGDNVSRVAQQAIQNAVRACQYTDYSHSFALAALGASHARAKNIDQAKLALEAAFRSASLVEKTRCAEWLETVSAGKAITPPWLKADPTK